jgi:Flp pilus assembly pilin Flp
MMLKFYTRVYTVLRGEEGQGLAEYALILTFIAVVAILALTFLGTQISELLSKVGGDL